jgi:hypothetical protein
MKHNFFAVAWNYDRKGTKNAQQPTEKRVALPFSVCGRRSGDGAEES